MVRRPDRDHRAAPTGPSREVPDSVVPVVRARLAREAGATTRADRRTSSRCGACLHRVLRVKPSIPCTLTLAAVLSLTPFAAASPAQAAPETSDADRRLAGADRFATAVAVSRDAHPDGARVVFLAAGDTYPDALAAGPAAHASGAPILLTGRTALPASTAAELARLSPGRVYVLGGAGVVSDAVGFAARDAAKAEHVYRVAGADRYATAARITEVFPPAAKTVYIASGEGFADALAGGVAAARQEGTVLLTGRSVLPAATRTRLAALAPERIVVLGGTGAVDAATLTAISRAAPSADVTRVAGTDRFDTAARVAARVWPRGSATVFVGAGNRFPDALNAVPAAAKAGAPILLTGTSCHPVQTTAARTALKATSTVTLGGAAVAYAGSRTCATSR